ncbi:DnaA regulatory inactivator Hda [Arenicellales bacterium IMCC58067]
MIGTDQIRLPLRLKESASLENFFCEGNREAVSFLRSLIASEGPRVVFLHGPDGAGKSHLLQACCRLTLHASRVPFYAALGMQESSPEMINGLEGADTVCLDDVDAIASDSWWEKALLNLFETVMESGRQLILAGRYPPLHSGFALQDLTTRLASGGVWAIKPLDEGELPEALRLRAGERGLEISDSVMGYLLRRVRRDSATLFNLLDQIDEQAFAHQRRLTVPFVRDLATRLLD